MIDLGKVSVMTKIKKAVGVPDDLMTPNIFVEIPEDSCGVFPFFTC